MKSKVFNLDVRVRIASNLLGEIAWQSPTVGFCHCPGEALHTGRNGRKDCRVNPDNVPTIFCVHSSCKPAVDKANHKMRSAIAKAESGGDGTVKKWKPSPEFLKRKESAEASARLKARASSSLPNILKTYSWSPEEAWLESPLTSDDVTQDWKLLLSMFPKESTLWIGSDVRESGRIENRRNFRTVSDWMLEKTCPGAFVCPAIFKPGIFARSQENILTRPFLVIESDTMKKIEICSVFRWLRQSLWLRAIVDTGNRSLHGWFDFPSNAYLEELKIILPALGCDPALFRPAQPVRLPGARRGDKWQSLVWFGGEK